MSFLDGGQRSADAMAFTDTDVYVLSRERFDNLSESHKRTVIKLLEGIANIPGYAAFETRTPNCSRSRKSDHCSLCLIRYSLQMDPYHISSFVILAVVSRVLSRSCSVHQERNLAMPSSGKQTKGDSFSDSTRHGRVDL